MANESLKVIQSIVGAQLYATDAKGGKKGKAATPIKPLVTISRQLGAGGEKTAVLLAQRLGVGLFDKELLKQIVKEAKGDKHLLEQLDERVTSLVDNLVHAFFSKKSTNKDTYFRYMAKVILNIGPAGGVIVGRGAHILLPEGRVLRVRVEGSGKSCAKRLVKQKEIKKSKAEKLMAKVNKDRDKFNKEVANRFPGQDARFDLVLNSNIYTPENMVRIIVTALEEAGFAVPPEAPIKT